MLRISWIHSPLPLRPRICVRHRRLWESVQTQAVILSPRAGVILVWASWDWPPLSHLCRVNESPCPVFCRLSPQEGRIIHTPVPSKLRVKGGKRDKGRERGRQPCEETDQKKKARRGGYWFKHRFWFEYRTSCIIGTVLSVGLFISTSHTWALESVYWIIAHIPSAQGLNVCHVCTRAFLHVFYVSFMFVFFHVCTFAHTVRVRLFASICLTYVRGFLGVLVHCSK